MPFISKTTYPDVDCKICKLEFPRYNRLRICLMCKDRRDAKTALEYSAKRKANNKQYYEKNRAKRVANLDKRNKPYKPRKKQPITKDSESDSSDSDP